MFLVRYLYNRDQHIYKDKKYKIYKSAKLFCKNTSNNSVSTIWYNGKLICEFQDNDCVYEDLEKIEI